MDCCTQLSHSADQPLQKSYTISDGLCACGPRLDQTPSKSKSSSALEVRFLVFCGSFSGYNCRRIRPIYAYICVCIGCNIRQYLYADVIVSAVGFDYTLLICLWSTRVGSSCIFVVYVFRVLSTILLIWLFFYFLHEMSRLYWIPICGTFESFAWFPQLLRIWPLNVRIYSVATLLECSLLLLFWPTNNAEQVWGQAFVQVQRIRCPLFLQLMWLWTRDKANFLANTRRLQKDGIFCWPPCCSISPTEW